MKHRMNGLVGGLIALSLVIGASAVAAGAMPDSVNIDACKSKKSAVTMSHKKHAKVACDTCHHTQKGLTEAKAAEAKKCSTCHLNPKDKALNCQEMSPKKNPFHARCITCHKSSKAGPTKCKECHK